MTAAVTRKPRARPQTSVAIPQDLLAAIKRQAEANTRTLSQEIVHALRQFYGQENAR